MHGSLVISKSLIERIRQDLGRTHDYAPERVGFLFCKEKDVLIFGDRYSPVDDADYDKDVGQVCAISSCAIRKIMEQIFISTETIFHVHEHSWQGSPELSLIDEQEIPKLLKSFHNIAKKNHGILLLSSDQLKAWVCREKKLHEVEIILENN